MVYCFAYNCNTNSKSGKSTFGFPPPEKKHLRNQWILACNRRKQDIECAKCPRLCEDQFNPDSFTKLPELAKAAGYWLDLKPNPNLFSRKTDQKSCGNDGPVSKKRKSLAFEKRQNLEVIYFNNIWAQDLNSL